MKNKIKKMIRIKKIYFIFFVFCGLLYGDVQFRSAWQGRWVSFGDYYLSIANCRENLCELEIMKFGESLPEAKTTLKLLSYTQAQALNKDCELIFQTEQRNIQNYETPYLFVEQNTCYKDKINDEALYQQNKVYPTFDCKKAKNPNETIICNNADDVRIAYYDIVLNDLYNELMKNLDYKKRKILKQQQDWLRALDDCETDLECLNKAYIERITALENQYCAECENE